MRRSSRQQYAKADQENCEQLASLRSILKGEPDESRERFEKKTDDLLWRNVSYVPGTKMKFDPSNTKGGYLMDDWTELSAMLQNKGLMHDIPRVWFTPKTQTESQSLWVEDVNANGRDKADFIYVIRYGRLWQLCVLPFKKLDCTADNRRMLLEGRYTRDEDQPITHMLVQKECEGLSDVTHQILETPVKLWLHETTPTKESRNSSRQIWLTTRQKACYISKNTDSRVSLEAIKDERICKVVGDNRKKVWTQPDNWRKDMLTEIRHSGGRFEGFWSDKKEKCLSQWQPPTTMDESKIFFDGMRFPVPDVVDDVRRYIERFEYSQTVGAGEWSCTACRASQVCDGLDEQQCHGRRRFSGMRIKKNFHSFEEFECREWKATEEERDDELYEREKEAADNRKKLCPPIVTEFAGLALVTTGMHILPFDHEPVNVNDGEEMTVVIKGPDMRIYTSAAYERSSHGYHIALKTTYRVPGSHQFHVIGTCSEGFLYFDGEDVGLYKEAIPYGQALHCSVCHKFTATEHCVNCYLNTPGGKGIQMPNQFGVKIGGRSYFFDYKPTQMVTHVVCGKCPILEVTDKYIVLARTDEVTESQTRNKIIWDQTKTGRHQMLWNKKEHDDSKSKSTRMAFRVKCSDIIPVLLGTTLSELQIETDTWAGVVPVHLVDKQVCSCWVCTKSDIMRDIIGQCPVRNPCHLHQRTDRVLKWSCEYPMHIFRTIQVTADQIQSNRKDVDIKVFDDSGISARVLTLGLDVTIHPVKQDLGLDATQVNIEDPKWLNDAWLSSELLTIGLMRHVHVDIVTMIESMVKQYDGSGTEGDDYYDKAHDAFFTLLNKSFFWETYTDNPDRLCRIAATLMTYMLILQHAKSVGNKYAHLGDTAAPLEEEFRKYKKASSRNLIRDLRDLNHSFYVAVINSIECVNMRCRIEKLRIATLGHRTRRARDEHVAEWVAQFLSKVEETDEERELHAKQEKAIKWYKQVCDTFQQKIKIFNESQSTDVLKRCEDGEFCTKWTSAFSDYDNAELPLFLREPLDATWKRCNNTWLQEKRKSVEIDKTMSEEDFRYHRPQPPSQHTICMCAALVSLNIEIRSDHRRALAFYDGLLEHTPLKMFFSGTTFRTKYHLDVEPQVSYSAFLRYGVAMHAANTTTSYRNILLSCLTEIYFAKSVYTLHQQVVKGDIYMFKLQVHWFGEIRKITHNITVTDECGEDCMFCKKYGHTVCVGGDKEEKKLVPLVDPYCPFLRSCASSPDVAVKGWIIRKFWGKWGTSLDDIPDTIGFENTGDDMENVKTRIDSICNAVNFVAGNVLDFQTSSNDKLIFVEDYTETDANCDPFTMTCAILNNSNRQFWHARLKMYVKVRAVIHTGYESLHTDQRWGHSRYIPTPTGVYRSMFIGDDDVGIIAEEKFVGSVQFHGYGKSEKHTVVEARSVQPTVVSSTHVDSHNSIVVKDDDVRMLQDVKWDRLPPKKRRDSDGRSKILRTAWAKEFEGNEEFHPDQRRLVVPPTKYSFFCCKRGKTEDDSAHHQSRDTNHDIFPYDHQSTLNFRTFRTNLGRDLEGCDIASSRHREAKSIRIIKLSIQDPDMQYAISIQSAGFNRICDFIRHGSDTRGVIMWLREDAEADAWQRDATWKDNEQDVFKYEKYAFHPGIQKLVSDLMEHTYLDIVATASQTAMLKCKKWPDAVVHRPLLWILQYAEHIGEPKSDPFKMDTFMELNESAKLKTFLAWVDLIENAVRICLDVSDFDEEQVRTLPLFKWGNLVKLVE
tara:strand:- start:5254 stop:10521 length:5268 start_codon:yes stop_codon:yes gene_type:complete